MIRLNVLLIISFIFSSLYLIYIRNELRKSYAELNNLIAEEQELKLEQQRLNLELQSQLNFDNLEKLARKQGFIYPEESENNIFYIKK